MKSLAIAPLPLRRPVNNRRMKSLASALLLLLLLMSLLQRIARSRNGREIAASVSPAS